MFILLTAHRPQLNKTPPAPSQHRPWELGSILRARGDTCGIHSPPDTQLYVPIYI